MQDEHAWESWTWDATLFEGSAPHYVRGRPPYAPGLASAIAEALSLDGTGRLLDVGCGPGTVALRLADAFSEVVGLDPDPGMIREAERLATEQVISNARWVCMRAEDLPGDLGTFDAFTFAASFHWMDRPTVARIVRGMVTSGGAVVQVDAPAYRREVDVREPIIHPLIPHERIAELRRRYLGPHQRAGQGLRNTSPAGEDEVFQAAGFAPMETVTIPDGRVIEQTVDNVVAMVFSSSSTAPHLFGDRIGSFETDLRELLASESPSGSFSVPLPANAIRIWRPASGS
jgi:SAM-dependent methyltransferase